MNDNSHLPVENTSDKNEYRSGFIAVVGRPNVGKSTLINKIVGNQVAITSSRPETTRKAIRAIVTRPNGQMVLVDTPGIHKPRTLLGQRLNDVVDDSLSDIDAIAFLLPADQKIGPGDRRILERLESEFSVTSSEDSNEVKWKKPIIAVVTKIDELSHSQLVDKVMSIDQLSNFAAIVPTSAKNDDNIAELIRVLFDALPAGPQMYPDDVVSEETPTETIAELIRGTFLEELNDELPHSLAVVVDDIERDDDTQPWRVLVSLYVERDSQKPIIIGHNAEHLVRVKKKLRTAVNRILGHKARLDLHVKVSHEWQSNPKRLDRLGF